jgi:hypothetical protein
LDLEGEGTGHADNPIFDGAPCLGAPFGRLKPLRCGLFDRL